jgi:lipopolysaccharide/colanic/teichoic acid biosynthesis glycosyltransferase
MQDDKDIPNPLTLRQRAMRRTFDVVLSILGLALTGWLIVLSYVAARIETGESGFFRQKRVGRYGETFRIFKLCTMRNESGHDTNVTTTRDPRITALGQFFRRSKIDELPQLLNILKGEMSFNGPRPDVPGYADELKGKDRIILSVRPGVTGPATLVFPDEEELLSNCSNPEQFNDEVLYPKKVEINCKYLESYSFFKDLRCVAQTALITLGLAEPPSSVNLRSAESGQNISSDES